MKDSDNDNVTPRSSMLYQTDDDDDVSEDIDTVEDNSAEEEILTS